MKKLESSLKRLLREERRDRRGILTRKEVKMMKMKEMKRKSRNMRRRKKKMKMRTMLEVYHRKNTK